MSFLREYFFKLRRNYKTHFLICAIGIYPVLVVNMLPSENQWVLKTK